MKTIRELFIHSLGFGMYLCLLLSSVIWLSYSVIGLSAEALVGTILFLPFIVLWSHVSFKYVQEGATLASSLVFSFVIRVVLRFAEKERKWLLLSRTGHAAPAEN